MLSRIILIAAAGQFALADAAVVITDIPDERVLWLGGAADTAEVDLNLDATTDLTLRSRGDFVALTSGDTRVAGFLQPGPDLGSWSNPFGHREEIGAILPAGMTWESGSANILSCRNIGCVGLWDVGTSYLGVEFMVGEELHYGWLEIEVEFRFGGGVLKRFAYETTPNVAIATPLVPEPSTLILLLIGVVGIGLAGRRRSSGCPSPE